MAFDVEAHMRRELDKSFWSLDPATNEVKDLLAIPNESVVEALRRKIGRPKRDWLLVASDDFKPTCTEIIEAFAKVSGISGDDITGCRRNVEFIYLRQAAMYACQKWAMCSYETIGRAFRGRNHSTVIHAVKKVTASFANYEALLSNVKCKLFETAGKAVL